MVIYLTFTLSALLIVKTDAKERRPDECGGDRNKTT